jgi:hypothetical protein
MSNDQPPPPAPSDDRPSPPPPAVPRAPSRLDVIPACIREKYHIVDHKHACAILNSDFKEELQDIVDCLGNFELLCSEIVIGGGRKSKIADRFDDFLETRGWVEKKTSVSRQVGQRTVQSETHKVDRCKGRIALEVEWNNKDPFYSRDLNVFRLLHELDEISVGVIITRADELQEIFDGLVAEDGKPVGDKYGPSTTHWSKLIFRVDNGEAGGCPLLLIGITKKCYRKDVEGYEAKPKPAKKKKT